MSSTEVVKTFPVIDTSSIDAKVTPFVARAKAAVVTNKDEDEAAKREFLAGKQIAKFIEDLYEEPTQILFKAHKDMVAKKKTRLAPLLEALAIYESKCLTFKRDQERKAKEIADALAALAKKDEEERQLREAIAAEDAGDKEGAEAIMKEEIARPMIAVEPEVAKVSGVGSSERWHAQVRDLKKLVKWVASKVDEDPGVLCYLEAAMPALNREAVSKKKLLTIPGVEAVAVEGMSGRTAR